MKNQQEEIMTKIQTSSDAMTVENPIGIPSKFTCRILPDSVNEFLRYQIGVIEHRKPIKGLNNDLFHLKGYGSDWKEAMKVMKVMGAMAQ